MLGYHSANTTGYKIKKITTWYKPLKLFKFMKKLFYLFLILPMLAISQIHVDNQWKNIINPIFDNLDQSKIQSGILLDYAMEFTDVTAYNGVLTDTTYLNANVLGDIYKTLFMAKVRADTTHTPLFDRYAYSWARERLNGAI